MHTEKTQKSPVIAIMGHIDHGKSTLLAYIRRSTKPLKEAGGITQHISAYEVEHRGSDERSHMITFLDTPGHEAFSGIRSRGAHVADIAVLVVSAEDGVKPQTKEAIRVILDSKTPFIVAITKIDKPDANIERTKLSLAENEIYVEGYGGTVSAIALSAKTGEGVPELLDMITLIADVEDLHYNPQVPGEGYILESNLDVQKGISATCIITNGAVTKGKYIASGRSIAPLRIIEDYTGTQISTAVAGQPIKVIGWDTLPAVGDRFLVCDNKEAAQTYITEHQSKKNSDDADTSFTGRVIPIVIKADSGGSLEALKTEIKKLDTERIHTKIILSGIGAISENDLKTANGNEKALVIGFTVKVDTLAKAVADRNGIQIQTFDIIYKLTEWLKDALTLATPSIDVEEVTGTLKVLKVFSKVKDRQILGGLVENGSVKVGAQIKIMRRDAEVGTGKIRELQTQKVKCDEVHSGKECGAFIEAKIEVAPGDRLQSYIISKQ